MAVVRNGDNVGIVNEVATLPAYQTLVELSHNRAWALLLTETFTSRKSSILASCRLANTLALVKYKLANSVTFEVVRNVANTAFLIKMVEEMDEISENYNYRFGANLERHTSLCKEDIMSIMEEEKENSGYNAYLDEI